MLFLFLFFLFLFFNKYHLNDAIITTIWKNSVEFLGTVIALQFDKFLCIHDYHDGIMTR